MDDTTKKLEAIGAKIRCVRRRFGMTLDDLAASSGVSKPYLSCIERGTFTTPSDEVLGWIERALNMRPGELVRQAHFERTPADVRALIPSDVLKHFLQGGHDASQTAQCNATLRAEASDGQ